MKKKPTPLLVSERLSVKRITVAPFDALRTATIEFIVSGEIQKYDQSHLYILVENEYEKLFNLNEDGITFIINFSTNPTTSQMQHNALKLIKSHNLFPILIKNPQYESNNNRTLSPAKEYTFAEELNQEQRTAITNIIEARNKPCSYVLFGPAGNRKIHSI